MSGSFKKCSSSVNPRIFRSSATYSRIFAIRAWITCRSTNDAALADALLEITDVRFKHRNEIEVSARRLNPETDPGRTRPFKQQFALRLKSMGKQRRGFIQGNDIHV